MVFFGQTQLSAVCFFYDMVKYQKILHTTVINVEFRLAMN